MRRLVWAFASRTYHIFGNFMPRLICQDNTEQYYVKITWILVVEQKYHYITSLGKIACRIYTKPSPEEQNRFIHGNLEQSQGGGGTLKKKILLRLDPSIYCLLIQGFMGGGVQVQYIWKLF